MTVCETAVPCFRIDQSLTGAELFSISDDVLAELGLGDDERSIILAEIEKLRHPAADPYASDPEQSEHKPAAKKAGKKRRTFKHADSGSMVCCKCGLLIIFNDNNNRIQLHMWTNHHLTHRTWSRHPSMQ